MTGEGRAAADHPQAPVQRALDLATLSAVVHNPAMRAFKARLAARGKKGKVILTAVARKLLVVDNAIVQSGQPWRSEVTESEPVSA